MKFPSEKTRNHFQSQLAGGPEPGVTADCQTCWNCLSEESSPFDWLHSTFLHSEKGLLAGVKWDFAELVFVAREVGILSDFFIEKNEDLILAESNKGCWHDVIWQFFIFDLIRNKNFMNIEQFSVLSSKKQRKLWF